MRFRIIVFMTVGGFLLFTGLSCGKSESTSSTDSGIQVIGLPSHVMNFYAAEQEASNWCWAACIQMVLSAQQMDVSQAEIVANVYDGNVTNRPGSQYDMLVQIDGLSTHGNQWQLEALLGLGPPAFELLQEQFERNTPLIAMYENPGRDIGHAVVITAIIYQATETGPVIRKVIVRDPWPAFHSSSGKRELTAAEFERIQAYLLVIPVRTPS